MARELLSQREYARRRGVALQAIQRHVASGIIQLVNGKVDPVQADNSWGLIRRARTSKQDDEAGQRSARSKVVVALAKLRLSKQAFETKRELYVDRAAALELAAKEADLVLAFFRNAPAAYAETFATELCIDAAVGLRILEKFMGLALQEIGDLKTQAIRDTERA